MKTTVLMLTTALLLSACATDSYTEETQVSETIYTAGNTVVGSQFSTLTTGQTSSLVGMDPSAIDRTGTYMDRQAEELKEKLASTNVQIQQQNNQLTLVMPVHVAFGTNQSTLDPQFEPVLAAVAKTIKEYDRTKIQVIGYTDNTGSILTNNALSLRRANAVSNFLRLNGVDINRIVVDGLGPQNPIAPNTTAAGRTKNHRVELTLINVQ